MTGTTNGDFSFSVADGHSCKGSKEHDPKEHDPKEHDPKEHDPKEHDPKEHDPKEHGGGQGHGGAGMDHSTMSGPSHTGGHSAAPGATHTGGGHSAASQANGAGSHRGMDHAKSNNGAIGELASGPLPSLPADGTAVLIALALCAALGVIGGVFLRTSAR